jgi:hypothetical protein
VGKANYFQYMIDQEEDSPIYVKQFPMPKVHKDIPEGQIKDWFKIGIIQPIKSRYNSHLFMMPKKDGSLRIVQVFFDKSMPRAKMMDIP